MKNQPSHRVAISRFLTPLASSAALLAMSLSSLHATPIPQNLGNGLRALAEKEAGLKPASQAASNNNKIGLADPAQLAIRDPQGRILVSVMLNGTVPLKTLQSQIATIKGTKITANSTTYRAGVIELFTTAKQAAEIAKMGGVSAVHLGLKPVHNIGKATTQGIVQHRIDKLPSTFDGSGITVGALSDSYNTNHGSIKASDDIASGDLPGPANPFGHTQRVEVLQDDPFGTDEGRAMLQIVHDIAPSAKLGFATADGGETGFADNIRSLASLPSGSLSKPNFKADVIVDDVIYFDEPMFQDGIIAQAVDDVAAAGVSYFSSAGNDPATTAYDATFRLVKNSANATAGTNLNFKGVDPALYKGGFHNFASSGAPQDIAQTVEIDGLATIVFQWNEPFDATPPTLGKVLQTGSGTLTDAQPTQSFDFHGTKGERIDIFADADPASSNPLPDVTITLIDPNGNVVATEDQTTDPEELTTFLPVSGTYQIVIGGFLGSTGDFIYKVRKASGMLHVATDFNLLFFNLDGRFLFAVAENNLATNRPIELPSIFGSGDVQMVIARANSPAPGAGVADHLRYVVFGGEPVEYVSYKDAGTYGHACAAGASGVGAYAFFPPFIPESYTSNGPVTIYFDRNNNPLPQPDRRQKPDMAAMDGGNTTFFVSDVDEDSDDLPNFFGTSAAAPHAGGIAALMLQAAGGPGSLSPTSLRTTMQQTAFPHDLDPSHSQAVAQAGGDSVLLEAVGDDSNTSSADPNFFRLTYHGGENLTQVTINLSKANPTETTKGLVFDTTATGLPFTLGHLNRVAAGAINPTFQLPAPPPAVDGQFKKLTIDISDQALSNGNGFNFGVDRDEADAFGPSGVLGGNSADLLGQGVLIPQGTLAAGGAKVTATLSNGKTLTGTFTNVIGQGYSPLDGFGFINAEAAVNAVKKP